MRINYINQDILLLFVAIVCNNKNYKKEYDNVKRLSWWVHLDIMLCPLVVIYEIIGSLFKVQVYFGD